MRLGGGLLAFCAVGLAVLTVLVLGGHFDGVDADVLAWFQTVRTPLGTDIFASMTMFGSRIVNTVLSIGIGVALLLSRRPGAGLAFAGSMLGGLVVSTVIKNAIARARPPGIDPMFEPSGYAFPSGHTAAAFGLFVTLALLVIDHVEGRALRIFCAGYALVIGTLVAVSRMYLGVHYLSDVIGGALVGTGCATAAVLIEHARRHRVRR